VQFPEVPLIRLVISMYLPSFLSVLRYTLLHLPFNGSMSDTSPPSRSTDVDHRYYVPLRLPNALLAVVHCSLSSRDTLSRPQFVFPSSPMDSADGRAVLRCLEHWGKATPGPFFDKEAFRLSRVPGFPL
jgi:hypothetical protein